MRNFSKLVVKIQILGRWS